MRPQARFLTTVVDARRLPPAGLPEVAFLGRSNVGKSTLLNCLLGQKLARTSGRPGRTQAIQLFEVDGRVIFADLPGYGYAEAPKAVQRGWQELAEGYLLHRESLMLCFVLLDARRGWMESDLQLKQWLEAHNRPFAVVATKSDKLNQRQRNESQKAIRGAYPEGDLFWFSGLTGQGVKEIWQTIWKRTAR